MDQSAVVDPFAAVPEHQQDQPVAPAVPSPEPVTTPPATEQPAPTMTAPEAPIISAEELQVLRTKLSDNESLLAQIREAAETQRKQREADQFAATTKDRLKETLTSLAHIDSTDELATRLYPFLEQQIAAAIQARDAEWQAEWQQEAVPYQTHYRANHLIKELHLPDTMYDTLVRFPDWNTMQAVAQAYRSASSTTASQQQQDAITRQREQARAAGVHAVGGVSGGSTPPVEYKDLTVESAVPILAKLLAR